MTFVILALRVLKFETSKVVVMFFKRGLKRFHNFENHTQKKLKYITSTLFFKAFIEMSDIFCELCKKMIHIIYFGHARWKNKIKI